MLCVPVLNEIQNKQKYNQKKSKDIHSQQQRKTIVKIGNLTFCLEFKTDLIT